MKKAKEKPVLTSKQVWLVTWEWDGSHNSIDNKVVAVINYRRTSAQISFFLEQLLIYRNSTAGEMAFYAQDSKRIPYKTRRNGIDADALLCGQNPWLYARRAYDFKVYSDNAAEYVLTWTEKHLPSNPRSSAFETVSKKYRLPQVKTDVIRF